MPCFAYSAGSPGVPGGGGVIVFGLSDHASPPSGSTTWRSRSAGPDHTSANTSSPVGGGSSSATQVGARRWPESTLLVDRGDLQRERPRWKLVGDPEHRLCGRRVGHGELGRARGDDPRPIDARDPEHRGAAPGRERAGRALAALADRDRRVARGQVERGGTAIVSGERAGPVLRIRDLQQRIEAGIRTRAASHAASSTRSSARAHQNPTCARSVDAIGGAGGRRAGVVAAERVALVVVLHEQRAWCQRPRGHHRQRREHLVDADELAPRGARIASRSAS